MSKFLESIKAIAEDKTPIVTKEYQRQNPKIVASKKAVAQIFSDAFVVALAECEEKLCEKFQSTSEAKQFVNAIVALLNNGEEQAFNDALNRFQRMKG